MSLCYNNVMNLAKGNIRNSKGQFVKGIKMPWDPHNKGKKGYTNKGSFKKGQPKSEEWHEAMKNRVPWNKGLKYKGKPRSEETKRKISESQKGKIIPESTRRKLRQYAGERASGWKGGISDKNDLIRKSSKMKEWKLAVYERDDYTCQKCGKSGVYLNAHHIKPFSVFPELMFDLDNGTTLCVPCHKETDTFAAKIRSSKYAK